MFVFHLLATNYNTIEPTNLIMVECIRSFLAVSLILDINRQIMSTTCYRKRYQCLSNYLLENYRILLHAKSWVRSNVEIK